MKKAMSLCGLIVFLMLILPLLACVASAEAIIIDTEKGVPGFWTEPARDLPANWQYVHDHPDTSADGWFDTNAYPPGQGNGSFWYTISFPDIDECKGIWETSVPYTGKYEVFAWIPSPDPFDPYLDESTPPSDYLPTKRAQYKVFHNDGVATVTIDQNVNMGGFTSLGVFVFDSTARVELSSNGVEFWRCVAFDAFKFVPVVNDVAVTDVSIIPPSMSVGQSTAICVTVTNEGTQQEENVSVKAFVDGAQVGSTKYVSLDPGASDTTTILWIPRAAKKYSVEGEVGVVSGETDTGDNTKKIEVGVLAMPVTAPTAPRSVHTIRTTPPEEAWNKTFGGSRSDWAYSAQQTTDGGYILAGYTYSYCGGYYSDFWLVKTDSNGNEKWNKTFGRIDAKDVASSVQQTADGGYILAGYTHLGHDILLVKTDSSGNKEWDKTIGGYNDDEAHSVQQTTDGGYILAGSTWSYGIGFWLVKTDPSGNEEWNRTFDTGGTSYKNSVQQTTDGGYILAGRAYDEDTHCDFWLAKTDSKGNEEWEKTFSRPNLDWTYSVQQTTDGGYVIAGGTYGGTYTGGFDFLLVKTDSNGNEEWNNTFGRPQGDDVAHSVQQTTDGGYILAGSTRSWDAWLVKTDSSGNMEWNLTFGVSNGVSTWDEAYSVQQTTDGGYILAGHTRSYGAGGDDFWLIKVKGEPDENNPPDAKPGGPYYGNVNEPIQFNGDGTPAMGRTIVAYEWSFNGVPVTEHNPTHPYSDDGMYVATLRVQDSKNLWSKPKECKVYVTKPFWFVQVTDVHIGWDVLQSYERFTEIINDINGLDPKPAFVLITGDQVDWNKKDFFYKFLDVLANLDSTIRYYHIPGNHDRRTNPLFGDDGLKNYHECILINGPRQILIGRDNYTFEYGGYLFVGLDSGKDLDPWWDLPWKDDFSPEGTGLTYEQMAKLMRLDNTKPKIVFMHHPAVNDKNDEKGNPPVPPNGPGGNDYCIAYYRDLFVTSYCNRYNVQLVLTGHTHKDKIFNAKGDPVGVNSKDRPLFIQTRSATKDEYGYRLITVTKGANPLSSQRPLTKWERLSVRVSDLISNALHAYDSKGRHTGIDENGNVVREIPETYYIGNYGGNLEGIIFYNTEEDYKLTVTLKDGSIEPLEGKLRQPENQSFNLTITNQTADSLTTISYNNITFTENTTATVNLNRTAVNYTMAIDYTGDNITDETKDPDSIETDYAPKATINTPVNNSIYRYGDQILFNGTGIDIEDGILTNSSLFWSSSLDGFIGIGCECNTTNLTPGTHIIELTVNDSSGQTDTDNVTLTVIAPDLAVTNIAFSNPQPLEGEAVTINATVHNNGTANAADITVQFFDGTPTNGTQIGANHTIATLNIGENKTVSVVWATTGEAGDNCIWVVADPADTIKEPDEENNQANSNIFVGAPDVLHIVQAQTDRAAYLSNEAVLISCIVQNASGNISANVSAEIEKPDSGIDNITMAEGIVGYYYGTFTNTSLSGRYNVTIYANRTGFVGDTESLCFEVLDTTPPASVTNITNTSGPTWINWTWDNPTDPDFDHTLIYLNGSWKTATAGNCYFADGLNASTEYEIATRTVDADGNINATWVNHTAATISPCFIATAAYGTALHEDINVLRDFRDEYLMPNPAGRTFVKIYYKTSPPLADVIRENEGLRTAVREGFVEPLVHITRMFVG